jgi:predicted nucleic acid-binding Zn ribbon protein
MKRRNAQTIGDVLNDFFSDNAELRTKMLETRVINAWGEILGATILQYTRNIYIKNHVLYVSLTSSVLRNELILSRETLLKNLNKHAGADVITDIVIH